MDLLLAPLQGFTDATFRQVWQSHFTGIDRYYAPYISLQNDGSIKNSQWRDILPERNTKLPIPQLLPSSPEEALVLMTKLDELAGYKEVNINMGCPYPMVTNRGRGSGLLPYPGNIQKILEAIVDKFGDHYAFSVKCRSGLEDFGEMDAVFKVLNQFTLKSVILHPRIGKQLYKGNASRAHFAKAKEMTDLPLVYNGDINSLEEYRQLVDEYRDIAGVMLGRGVLKNPLLPQEIERKTAYSIDEKRPMIKAFVLDLLGQNRERLSGDSHLLSKMKSYLPYWETINPEKRKAFKKMKKANGMSSFEQGLLDYLT